MWVFHCSVLLHASTCRWIISYARTELYWRKEIYPRIFALSVGDVRWALSKEMIDLTLYVWGRLRPNCMLKYTVSIVYNWPQIKRSNLAVHMHFWRIWPRPIVVSRCTIQLHLRRSNAATFCGAALAPSAPHCHRLSRFGKLQSAHRRSSLWPKPPTC